MPRDDFSYLRIIYLKKGGSQAYALEAKTAIVAGAAPFLEDANCMKHGLMIDTDIYIPPSAIIEVARCNSRGYTKSELDRMPKAER